MEKWKGKIAVVTGGSSGKGAAIVEELVSNGLTVINLDRDINEENASTINSKSEVNGKLYVRKCDISDTPSLKEAFKWIDEKFQFINVHVNCAGVGHNISVLSDSEDVEERINSKINRKYYTCYS